VIEPKVRRSRETGLSVRAAGSARPAVARAGKRALPIDVQAPRSSSRRSEVEVPRSRRGAGVGLEVSDER